MITLNKLTKELHDEMLSCHWKKPPLHLTSDFVVPLHVDDACPTFEREFSEREELAADIIIDVALALRQLGCKNIEQVIKDRIAWRLRHRED